MNVDTVRDIVTIIPDARLSGNSAAARRKVGGFSTDSRSLTTGEAFIALSGENFDGHDFLDRAAGRGASVAVVSERWLESQRSPAPSLPLIVVDDTLVAYGMIARAHRERFSYPVIAVAGSNGKTMTKELVADLLATRGPVLRTEGNLNNLIGVPAMMLRMSGEHRAAVIEIGTNTPGEIAQLCQILRPTHGLITNIGREHLELLGSLDGVAAEEGALFEYLDATGGIGFVNLDDRYIARMGKRLARKVTYGKTIRADLVGRAGALDRSGSPRLTITDRRNERSIDLQLHTPGKHTATNALAAAAVALTLRIAPKSITRALEAFRPKIYTSGYARLAAMTAANGATVLNDTYNANPDSVEVALATLAAIKPKRGGRRIAVLGDMFELGKSAPIEHRKIGEEIARIGTIDLVFFHGDGMRRAHRILSAREESRTESRHFSSKEKLGVTLAKLLSPEDVVLVKGSRGMRMEEIVKVILGAGSGG